MPGLIKEASISRHKVVKYFPCPSVRLVHGPKSYEVCETGRVPVALSHERVLSVRGLFVVK